MDCPTITVIVRSVGEHARAAALQRAVCSALSQRDVRTECIVVFNGHRYDAASVDWAQQQPRTRCIFLDAPDKPAATFVGRALVTSEFFCYLDDDDELLPDALARRVAIMRRHPLLDCVATNGYYVEGNTTRVLFEQTERIRSTGYVDSLLSSRNWLASCGGLFRSATVKMSYFQQLPRHREWTVIAFRIASTLNVHFEDIATFKVNSSPDSQSKKDSYVDAGADILEELKRCTNDAQHIRLIRCRQAAAFRAMCSYYRLRGDFAASWRAYWNVLRSDGGWTYLPYALLLLFHRVEPFADLLRRVSWRKAREAVQ